MPSKKPVLAIRTNKEIVEKIKYIAEKQNRSTSKEIEMLIKNHIMQYEQYNGTIKIPEDNQ